MRGETSSRKWNKSGWPYDTALRFIMTGWLRVFFNICASETKGGTSTHYFPFWHISVWALWEKVQNTKFFTDAFYLTVLFLAYPICHPIRLQQDTTVSSRQLFSNLPIISISVFKSNCRYHEFIFKCSSLALMQHHLSDCRHQSVVSRLVAILQITV